MRKIVAILMAMLMVMSVTVALAGGVAAKGTEPKVPVIIGFKDTPGQADKDMIRGLGGDIKYEYHLIPAIAVSMSPQACDAMRKNKNVAYIEPDGEVHALQTIPWGIDRVFGDEKYSFSTWDSSRGSDVAVAVLDTGIDEYHEDLTVLGGTNTIDGTHWGADGHGHGTHVAGTVAALDNTVGVVGVAPDVGLYAVKVLADSGSGTVSSVVAGIEWSVDNNMQIISMSLGTSTDYQTLRDAVDAAYGEGLLLVAAAGNDGNPAGRGDNVGYPAKYESVIAVAATDQNDNRASWSSTGPAVELAAPGVSINSTLPGDKYGTKSGTSMACPHVTGVAALVWAVNPGLNNTDVRGILQQTAEDLGLPATHQGYGLVRADAAVAMAEGTEPPATGSINGTVTDTDETAIEGATVVVEGTTLSATTGAEGYYLLENVPVGDQEVTASANGYYSNTTTVTVIKDDTVTQDFTLEAIPTYTVSGTVTDTKDTALEGAIVTIAGTELSATTEGDGSYSISEVKDGTYDITASKEGYSSQTNKTVTVNEDTVVNFALEEITVTTLNVKVTTDKEQYSRNSWVYITVTVTDTEDQAVGGASVGLTVYYPDESVAATGSGTTNSNGIVELRYRVMPKAPTGDYKVVATADLEGYETGTGETMFKVV